MIQPVQDSWQTPPEPIVDMLNRPKLPAVAFSRNAEWIIELGRASLPSIADLAEPTVALAGLKINPRTWESAKAAHYRTISVRRLHDQTARQVALPDNARIRNLQWSYCGQYLSFTHTHVMPLAEQEDEGEDQSGLSLWVLDLEKAEARSLTGPILNAISGSTTRWLPDNSFVCKVRDQVGPIPVEPAVSSGPTIEENLGRVAPARTYTNLLENPHDELLLEYYLRSKLVWVSFTGEQKTITEAALFRDVSVSPDGQWLKVTKTHRPFSYQVPMGRFPRRTEILTLAGERVYTVSDLPLAEEIPINFDSVRAGIRASGWRADKPATLYWVEALDGGDARQTCDYRDAVYTLSAPFEASPELLWKSELRFNSLMWGDGKTAIAYEALYNTRELRTLKLTPDDSTVPPQLIDSRNFQDAYSSPGEPVMTPGPYSWQTLLLSKNGDIYLNGRGASAEGVYPFLDRLDLTTGEKERLWQSPKEGFSRVSKVLDSEATQFIVRKQSKSVPGNYWLHEKDSEPLALTHFADPLPWYKDVHKEIVRYQRSDGLALSGTLYLPPGHDVEHDGPLPTLLWVYPEEHKSRETASQVTKAEDTFGRPNRASAMFLLTQGYALLSGPSMPIVGEKDVEPNDTYLAQLVDSASAAVEYLVGRGVCDRSKIAIGGHSYGAFTTANLLAHTDLFCAGIARSGAYNRSLTPFGFQGEQRNFWEATDTYLKMSPFVAADKINHPLLLIHGAADNNSGTYPIQTERLYEAIKGLGGTVRYVSLPHEEHSYRSREAVGHVLWEMVQWLDIYVKQV
ncbi:MAG: prolyl oligopeptidase family serine peptidase [Cyanobacteria bacterium J06598_1]